jgi:hypothetical protein
MNEEIILTPKIVALRLTEMINSIKNHEPIDISEEEIRKLQHFFNERSTVFLKKAQLDIRKIEARKRR